MLVRISHNEQMYPAMRLLKHLVDPANVMPILRTMPAISNGSDSRELPCAVTFHKFPWGSTRPRVIRATAGELRAFHRMSAIARISNAAGCVVQPPFIAKGVHGIEACAEAALGNFNLDLVRVVAIDLSGRALAFASGHRRSAGNGHARAALMRVRATTIRNSRSPYQGNGN
jgi:hypothetical protein